MKYWVSLAATLVSGVGVVTFYAPVFNGIEQANSLSLILLVISTLALIVSASCHYYFRAVRKNPKTYNDLSILEGSSSDDNRGKLDK